MKTTIIATACLVGLIATSAIAGPREAQKRGYILNNEGGKCWYNSSLVEAGKHFFRGSMTGTAGVITFDNPTCMKDGYLEEIGREINIELINTIMSRWYSHSDAKFQTGADKLYSGSLFQIRGQCIQSLTYPNIGIVVDYIVDDNSIVKVMHIMALRGCE